MATRMGSRPRMRQALVWRQRGPARQRDRLPPG